MQNYCKTIGALAAASALVAGNASAEEVNYELHGGYTNQYIFRGVELGSDLAEVGIDMETKWNGLVLSAGAWYGTFNTTQELVAPPFPPRPINTDYSELDIYGEVSKDLGFLTASVGYIYYMNSNSEIGGFFPAVTAYDDQQEVYFSVGRDLGFATASLTYFWEIEGENDGYTELALSRDIKLSPCLTLGLKSALGYAVEDGEVANWTTSAKLNWAFTETATLSPFVAVSVSDSAEDLYESDNEVELVGGSMLTVKF